MSLNEEVISESRLKTVDFCAKRTGNKLEEGDIVTFLVHFQLENL